MTISIQNRQKRLTVDVGRVRRSLKRLLKELGFKDSEVSLLLVDDAQIREINKSYLHRDRPTNVISFAMTEGAFGDVHPEILGDIILSVETAARDATAGDIDFMEEIEFLLIHGLLHLLGYKHENVDSREAEKMKKLERELFFSRRHYHLD
ncbi:MAG: rRNA maturation RNase YbeY [Syntrophobacterales bacterium CG_4_8_14_3_um_filter_58_8]|nr:MAG: rRNA maturation RNase YbeY [Syntrophaceae bacterium CG2_30_58_14]PJC72008.1 MAG: rRNA maturation RNase YbeY [Syntrophobacterales bacterium CG_4_8_14_3_um_filter_58_8]